MFDSCSQGSIGITTEEGRDCKLGRFNGLSFIYSLAMAINILLLNSKTGQKMFKSCSDNIFFLFFHSQDTSHCDI